jgi:hypothetical protein
VVVKEHASTEIVLVRLDGLAQTVPSLSAMVKMQLIHLSVLEQEYASQWIHVNVILAGRVVNVKLPFATM